MKAEIDLQVIWGLVTQRSRSVSLIIHFSMSTRMMPSSRKPPLARSPIHLRPRRPLQPNRSTTIQTPSGSLTKAQLHKSACEIEESSPGSLRPEYRTISCELRALAKMVHQEFSSSSSSGWGGDDAGLVSSLGGNRSPLFERGRFYDEYSARRNERLKRKKGGETGYDGKKAGGGYDLGVRVESAKRRGESSKRFESLRKTVPCSTPMNERTNTRASSSRYLLRSSTSSKENKKPPLAVAANVVDRSATVRRATRKN
ncbi:hypothetical protein ACH5RR_035331 [Cinchona calisaya]|uniref:Uncharacterized protein n=1 Tax=Cinchona calisaya TaxID=153742 RepID=A0ABD2YDS8_9GENT